MKLKAEMAITGSWITKQIW